MEVFTIRHFLMGLVARITRCARYHPEMVELNGKLNWSTNLWVSNIFRLGEWLFGRRYGIRREASTQIKQYDDEVLYVRFEVFTVEALLSHIEATIRLWLTLPSFSSIPKPVYLTLGILGVLFSIKTTTHFLPLFGMAIARDTDTDDTTTTATNRTTAHTTTGSNLVMVVGLGVYAIDDSGSDTISAVTYNAVSVGAVDTQKQGNIRAADRLLVNPSTGANNLVTTVSANTLLHINIVTYTGCSQTAQPHVHATGTSLTNTLNLTTTSTVGSCWFHCVERDNQGGTTAGAGVVTTLYNPGGAAMGDSNGAIAAGAYTMTWTDAGAGNMAGTILAIQPPIVTAISKSYAFFM